MPIQMKSEPKESAVQNQVPYLQQLQQVVGNGLGCGPQQFGIPGGQRCLPGSAPVCSVPSSTAPVSYNPKTCTKPDVVKPIENIEDRIDVESIKGVFGWETVDGVNVPYILRKKKKFVAVRIVERKLLSRYPNSFPDELSRKEPLVSYFVTENEAKLLNEINSIHCSYEYGQQDFTGKDLIVDLSEFEDFYNIVKKTFPDDVLARFQSGIPQQIQQSHALQQPHPLQPPPIPPQPPPPQHLMPGSMPDHDKTELAKVCGWVQINNTVSPYIKRFNGKYVPLSVIKYAAGLLTDVQIEGILPTQAECNLLNDTCKIAGFDFNFGQSTKVIHLSEVTQRCKVNILELPFDDPLSHAQYLDLVTSSPPVLQKQEDCIGIPPQSSIPPTDINVPVDGLHPQVESMPPGIAPNISPFGRYPNPHYSPSAASPAYSPYMNMMSMMRPPFPPQSVSNYSVLPQGQRLPVMSPDAVPHGSVTNLNSPSRQVSSKLNHQTKTNSNLSPYGLSIARNSYGPVTSGNSYGPHTSCNSYGPHTSTNSYGPNVRNPFGPSIPGSQFLSSQSTSNQMYVNSRMMSPHMLPNGHSRGPSQPGFLGKTGPSSTGARQSFSHAHRYRSPNVSVVPNSSSSVSAMKIPQRVSVPQLPTPPLLAATQLPTSSHQPTHPFAKSNTSTYPRQQFPVSHKSAEHLNVRNTQISPKQAPQISVISSAPSKQSSSIVLPTTAATTAASDSKKEEESTEKLVSKITGVVLNGKSISCMAVNESDRSGQFCLIEAVCKLYFSQSSMNEFLYALQNVLKIPLYSCTDKEEKAFIQYYNLPVSVLKCNKMIKLTDLSSYFPQMSYMFTQTTVDDADDASTTRTTLQSSSGGGGDTSKVIPSDIAENSEKKTNKRPSSSPAESESKQPCQRLEEMVKKLREGQDGAGAKETTDVIVLDD